MKKENKIYWFFPCSVPFCFCSSMKIDDDDDDDDEIKTTTFVYYYYWVINKYYWKDNRNSLFIFLKIFFDINVEKKLNLWMGFV